MGYGMIAYTVPLARYPDTYNGQPLCYVALAAQKHHYSLYLTCAYQPGSSAGWLAEQFARAGKRLDMGKSCVRFKSLDDLPLPAIGEFIAATPPEKFIATYEAVRAAPRERPARKVSAAGKPSTRKSATRESATGKAATRKSATRESTRRNPRERT